MSLVLGLEENRGKKSAKSRRIFDKLGKIMVKSRRSNSIMLLTKSLSLESYCLFAITKQQRYI